MNLVAVAFVATSLSGGAVSGATSSAVHSGVRLAAATPPTESDSPPPGGDYERHEFIPLRKVLVAAPIITAAAVFTIGTFAWLSTASDRRQAISDYENAHQGFGFNFCTTNSPECQDFRVLRDARRRADTAWKVWAGATGVSLGALIAVAIVIPNEFGPWTKISARTRLTPTLGGLQLEGSF